MDAYHTPKLHINGPSLGTGVHQRHRIHNDGIFATRYNEGTFHFNAVDRVVDPWPLTIDISDMEILHRSSRFQSKSTPWSVKAVEKLFAVRPNEG
jgi:hypothetical protein